MPKYVLPLIQGKDGAFHELMIQRPTPHVMVVEVDEDQVADMVQALENADRNIRLVEIPPYQVYSDPLEALEILLQEEM